MTTSDIEMLAEHYYHTKKKADDALVTFNEFTRAGQQDDLRRKWKVFLNCLDMSFQCFEKRPEVFCGKLQKIMSDVGYWRGKNGSILSYLMHARNSDFHVNRGVSSQWSDHVEIFMPDRSILGLTGPIEDGTYVRKGNRIHDRHGVRNLPDITLEIENAKVKNLQSNTNVLAVERKAFLKAEPVYDRGILYDVPKPKVPKESVAIFLGAWALDYLVYNLERFCDGLAEMGVGT